MRLAAVQLRSVRGDLDANLAGHLRLAEWAAAQGAEALVFPELSLTGYEPSLAGALAMTLDDPRLAPLQRLADERGVAMAVGLPTRGRDQPRISLALFHPRRSRALYSKRYLHHDETPFFEPGDGDVPRLASSIALAICFELSVAAHAPAALALGATVYAASVAKSRTGVEHASTRLSEIARAHGVITLMANAVGPAEGFDCAGASAAWARDGARLATLEPTRTGIVLVDTDDGTASAIELGDR